MSYPQRREFLAAAATITSLATLGGTQPAAAGDPSFMNNVPDPALVGKELPTFKFALEKSDGKVIGNSYGKEATVEQLPISKGIAGVSMRLEPGAMRELHWHATAAEWAFVIEGRVRTTVIDPQGIAETNDFEPGDVWYFPRGHGHMLAVPGRQAVPLHPDLRQRLLLRVRHVQHHRLDRPHPQAAAGEELRPARVGLRRLPEGGSLLRPRPAASGRAGAAAAGLRSRRRRRTSIACSPSRRTAIFTRAAASGGSIPAAFRSPRRSPAWSSTSSPARCASCTGTRRPTSGSTSSTGEVSVTHVRLARPLSGPRRSTRATSATSRKATATRSRTSATSRAAS